MLSHRWVKKVIYLMVVASLPFSAYCAEIIYDSPEDLMATDPSNSQTPPATKEQDPVVSDGKAIDNPTIS